eukprot:9582808-Alexandrium_andersonii.AAC.1
MVRASLAKCAGQHSASASRAMAPVQQRSDPFRTARGGLPPGPRGLPPPSPRLSLRLTAGH